VLNKIEKLLELYLLERAKCPLFILILTSIVMIKYLEDVTWTRAKGNDIMIGCAIVVSVSALCSRHLSLAFSSYTMTHLPYRL